MRRTALFALSLVLGASAAAGQPTPGWLRIQVPETGAYALRYLPPGVDPASPSPLVVFLHGAGSTPEAWKPYLEGVADELGCLLLLPKSDSPWGWGIGRDAETIAAAREWVAAELAVDPSRVGIGGHSSGGAFAYVLAYGTRSRFAAVFTLAAPFRTVLAVADDRYAAPLRLYYGTADPNYGVLEPLSDMFDRLGVPWEAEVLPGQGHGSWPETTLREAMAFLLAHRYPLAGPCRPGPHRLCLGGGRFAVEATWNDGRGGTGGAWAVPAVADDSGILWFFSAENWEMLVKVLDGCWRNDRYWVFAAATTDVEYELTVTDLVADRTASYHNPQGVASPAITDTSALPTCP